MTKEQAIDNIRKIDSMHGGTEFLASFLSEVMTTPKNKLEAKVMEACEFYEDCDTTGAFHK